MDTKLTTKGQTTVPKEVRAVLGVAPGDEVQWNVVRGIVVVGVQKKIKDPVRFLTGQTKLDLDMVALVKEVRDER